jgi:hypothetical protein
MQKIYMSVYVAVGRISHNESSMHGHESFKIPTSFHNTRLDNTNTCLSKL